jgi:hypothetical protein
MIDFLDAYVPIIRWTGLSVLITTWLIVSFTQPSPRRVVFECLATLGLYVTILSFVLHGMYLALHMESATLRLPAVTGLSLLSFLFCTGSLVALVQFVSSLRGPGKTLSDATH